MKHIERKPNIQRENEMQSNEIKDKLGNIHQVQILHHPTQLPDTIQARLVTELTPVTGRGFLRKDVHADALYSDVAQHVLNCERLIIARDKGEVSCFIAMSLKEHQGKKIYHLEGIIVEHEYHGTGLAYQLLQKDIQETAAQVLAFHTQSVAMYKLGKKLARLSKRDALTYAQVIGTTQQRGQVDVGRYGGQSLYEKTDEFKNTALKNINYKNGDALICAGKVFSFNKKK